MPLPYTLPFTLGTPIPSAPTTIPATVSADPLERLNQDLLYGDPITAARAAEELARYRQEVSSEFFVTVHDKLWRPIGAAGDDTMELSGTDPWNTVPAATLKLKGDSPLVPTMMGCRDTMVGITVESGGLRFPYYVKTHDYEFDRGEWTSTATLSGVWDILNYYQIWPQWYLPIQAQPISHAIFVGPIVTCIENMISECALRLQSGIWEFINGALSLDPDIRAWFGTLLQSNGNIFEMLKTPTYVVRDNPLTDTSPLTARTVRMESCGTVIKDITRPYGVDVRVDLFLPGDAQPDIWTSDIPGLALDQPTYVVTVKDRQQIRGPTGTVADSVIATVVDIGGAFFGDIPGVIEQVPSMEGVYTSPLLGQKWVAPWAVIVAPEKGKRGTVENCKISDHTQTGWQHIIGGRSPKWLNDLMNSTFAWIIDSLSILIGITGIPSNLLDGFLNNAFLAFELMQHYPRRDANGPYHPAIEQFHATASAPYNIETMFAFVNAFWDSRGWTSAQATFRNGEVYTLGKDVFRGGLMSILYLNGTKLLTDYIRNIMFRFTPNARDIFIQIGDGKAEESPLAKHQRDLTGLLETINVLTLAPQS
jgi:hypothetical protein